MTEHTSVMDAVKKASDELLASSQCKHFEAVDDEVAFPIVKYFDDKGNMVSVNIIKRRVIYHSISSLGKVRKVPLSEIRDLLYALEGAALSWFVMEHEQRIPDSVFQAEIEIEGDSLMELFTNLLSHHQDTSTRDHFQSELKRLNGDT